MTPAERVDTRPLRSAAQQQTGVPDDGICGPRTYTALARRQFPAKR